MIYYKIEDGLGLGCWKGKKGVYFIKQLNLIANFLY